MAKSGPRFYDEASVFDTYWAHRGTPDAPNQTMERPVFLELLGDPRAQDVLDLGCGDGAGCDRAWNGQGQRQAWVVDDYFRSGAREVQWMGSTVTKYHRSVEDYYAALRAAGFSVDDVREARPQRAHFLDDADFERRQRIPLFLLMAARKS